MGPEGARLIVRIQSIGSDDESWPMKAFWRDAVEFLPILMSGVALTIIVTIGSLLLSTVLGLVWALMRVSGIGILTGISAGLINVIRGIPIIVLLFYLYFVMPEFGVT